MEQPREYFQRGRASGRIGLVRGISGRLLLCRDRPAKFCRSRILFVKLLSLLLLHAAQQPISIGVADHPIAETLQRIALPELPKPQNLPVQGEPQPRQLSIETHAVRSLPVA